MTEQEAREKRDAAIEAAWRDCLRPNDGCVERDYEIAAAHAEYERDMATAEVEKE